MSVYDHPNWWTDELEREAVRAARQSWLKRCSTCGIVMRTDAARCGENEDGHEQ